MLANKMQQRPWQMTHLHFSSRRRFKYKLIYIPLSTVNPEIFARIFGHSVKRHLCNVKNWLLVQESLEVSPFPSDDHKAA